ncbi:type B 50S ribosomal protein L31 [Candidatus Woesebacteria bacterium]|nr:type B 50S ribosomal protein L31 [Candidatus Woesebacteria bacterium]
MKKNIHPTLNPVIFIDEDTKSEIVSKSTLTSDETREVDGVKYFIIRLDVTSFSHPFFTGEMRFVDRQGRVDKFIQKMEAAKTTAGKKKKKLAKQADDGEDSKSYREILQEQQTTIRKSSAPQATESASTPASQA